MAPVRTVEPVVRFCGLITRHEQARRWAIEALTRHWGQTLVVSPAIPFEAGGYYTPSMGTELQKVLIATEGFSDPAELADWKLQSNGWEEDYAALSDHPEARPLNLDPGYISQAKLVLGTTKDRDHRIYLRDGIFAEVTLTYVGKEWNSHRWSYPSYRTPQVAQFAMECRKHLRKHLKEARGFRS